MNNDDELTLQTNDHLRKKVGRPRKPIWQHFTEISSSNNSNNKRPGARCNYCGQQWARGKSSEMVSHIALSCGKPPPPEIRIKFQTILQNDEFSEDDDIDGNSKKKQKQTKMFSVSRWYMNKRRIR
jgi:hypothetical protein